MTRLIALLLAFSGSFFASAAEYGGNVGKKKAVFSLDWKDDGTVSGTYSYPHRPGVVYTLRGKNAAAGELYLEEYTGDDLTARCYLSKVITDDEIIWKGEMRNLDGRHFPMMLSRVRETTTTTAPTNIDTYETQRAAIRAKIRPLYQWEVFPLADEVVEMVPVHFPGAQHFNARITSFRSDEGKLALSFVLGEWNEQEGVLYENGPAVTLEMTRPLPLDATMPIGSACSVVFAADGSLLTVDLCSVAVTHARKATGGKLEVRGLLEFWRDGESTVPSQQVPVIEFVPDKLSLFEYGRNPDEDIFYQSIRLVKDYGITIQATDAGSGMLELESLSLEPEAENPWIPVEGQGIIAPPAQQTGQAG